MAARVKVFAAEGTEELERQVNAWLAANGETVEIMGMVQSVRPLRGEYGDVYEIVLTVLYMEVRREEEMRGWVRRDWLGVEVLGRTR